MIIALGGSSNLVNQASIWWGYEHFIGHRSKLGIPISKWSTLKLCETLWSLLRLKFWLPKLGFHDNSKIAYSVLYLIGGLEHVLFFHNIWDNPSHWLIFFRGVETTNQYVVLWLMSASIGMLDVHPNTWVATMALSLYYREYDLGHYPVCTKVCTHVFP